MLPKYKNSRVKFNNGEQTDFLTRLFLEKKIGTTELAEIVKVSPRTVRDWKREKFYIPLKTLLYLCDKYKIKHPPNLKAKVIAWEKHKLDISKKGGLAHFKKYGIIGTRESRIRGGIAGLKRLRELGLAVPIKTFNSPPKSMKLAEFVGIMLGDGHVGKLQIEITLNSLIEEKYVEYVSNLCNDLFGCFPKILKRKDCNAFSVYYNGINLVRYLNWIGLNIGDKVKQQASVPLWVRSNDGYSRICCRGLIDTDGCIAIHRYYVNNKRYFYKKLIFTNHSIPIANFVYNTLYQNGLHPKMYSRLEKRRVWLYNSNEVQKYLNIFGTSNEKLLKFKESGLDGKAASC